MIRQCMSAISDHIIDNLGYTDIIVKNTLYIMVRTLN